MPLPVSGAPPPRASCGRAAGSSRVDVSAEQLAAFAADSADIVGVTADITDSTAVGRIVAAASTRIDGVANVAGIADDFAPAHEVSDTTWQRIMGVNVDGTFRLIRTVIPAMLAVGSGAIVNVASEAALRGSAAGIAYTASKHVVLGITHSCAFMFGAAARNARNRCVA